MASVLDTRYFDLLTQEKIPGTDEVAQAWACKNPEATAILVPVQDPSRPICAISIVPVNEAVHSENYAYGKVDYPHKNNCSILTKRSGLAEGKFQTLFSEEGPFKIILTNLTSNQSNSQIKIDILAEDKKVTEPRPANRLNEVNVLSAAQSYEVEGDYRFGNHRFTVEGIKKKDGSLLSVGEDEASSRPVSRHFFVNVTGAKECPEITSLLEGGTSWIPAEQFVRIAKNPTGAEECGEECGEKCGREECGMPILNGREECGMPILYGREVGRRTKEAYIGNGDESAYGGVREEHGFIPESHSTSRQAESAYGNDESDDESADGFGGSFLEMCKTTSVKKCVDVTSSKVSESQAGRLGHGEQVQVNSHDVSTVFDYETPGKRMEFGLSVLPSLREFDTHTLPQEVAILIGKEDIAKVVEAYNKNIISKLDAIFKQDECIVCYDVEPSKIVIRCGHQCVCDLCFADPSYKKDECPMCRGNVLGYVDAINIF